MTDHNLTQEQVTQFVRGNVRGPRINRFIPRIDGGVLESFMTSPMIVSRIVSGGKVMLAMSDCSGGIVTRKELQEVIDSIMDFYTSFSDDDINQINHHSIEEQESKPEPGELTDWQPRPTLDPGYVYILQCNMYYKIGKSKDPEKRTAQISPKLPFPTVLIHTIKTVNMSILEQSLHEKYAHCRKNGEWFTLSEDELNEIKAIPQAGE